MARPKSKIFLFAGLAMVLVMALSACTGGLTGLTGSETGVPYQRQNHQLAGTEQPFPAGVEGATSPAGIVQLSPGIVTTSMVATEAAGESKPVPVTGEGSANTNGSENGISAFPTRQPEVRSRLSANDANKTPPANPAFVIPNTGEQSMVGAQVYPSNKRSLAFLFSNMVNANVYDKTGQTIGTVADYVINMCSDQVSYMLVIPFPGLVQNTNVVMAVPYEVVTQGHGLIDVTQHNLVLPITVSQLQSAPVLS